MSEQSMPPACPDICPAGQELTEEVVRLNKIIGVLLERAVHEGNVEDAGCDGVQAAVLLEEQVRIRTAELAAALRENEKISRALHDSENRFHGLVNQSLVGVSIIEDGKFTYTNPRFTEVFGYSAEEALQMGPLDVVLADDRANVSEQIRRRLSGETDRVDYVFRGRCKDGASVDIECYGSRMESSGRVLIISLMLDISARIRAEREVLALQETLREQSTHDALTGLYNRRFLEESLARELILAQREGHPVSIIMGDLDHFKIVNDRHGHLAGDEVLRAFGALMKRHSRGSDVYCRYGGEEFLLVLPRMAQEKALVRAEQLRAAIAATPIACGAAPITVTASFGVATFPGDGDNGDQLIAAADRALYAAKAAGRNCVQGCLATVGV